MTFIYEFEVNPEHYDNIDPEGRLEEDFYDVRALVFSAVEYGSGQIRAEYIAAGDEIMAVRVEEPEMEIR